MAAGEEGDVILNKHDVQNIYKEVKRKKNQTQQKNTLFEPRKVVRPGCRTCGSAKRRTD